MAHQVRASWWRFCQCTMLGCDTLKSKTLRSCCANCKKLGRYSKHCREKSLAEYDYRLRDATHWQVDSRHNAWTGHLLSLTTHIPHTPYPLKWLSNYSFLVFDLSWIFFILSCILIVPNHFLQSKIKEVQCTCTCAVHTVHTVCTYCTSGQLTMFNARSGLRLPLDGANARWGVPSEQFMGRIFANIATEFAIAGVGCACEKRR